MLRETRSGNDGDEKAFLSLPIPSRTPFKHKFDIHNELRADLRKVRINETFMQECEIEKKLNTLCNWLCMTPNITTLRVNISNISLESACELIKNAIKQDTKTMPVVTVESDIPELIIIHCWDSCTKLDLKQCSREVIVDAACGSAVLRGAHVFAPGVMGIPHGLVIGDKVSVFADIVGQCKKGLIKKYDDNNKVFLGNGVIKQTREHLFGSDVKAVSGIAVHMTDVVSRIPQINNNMCLKGNALLQNLPSIVCSRVLNPQPGETVLDMCAAPGNKTTHISFLMRGEGMIIALEKNKSKIEQIKRNCKEFSASNVNVFCCDSTKAVSDGECNSVMNGPPFREKSFDRILLDSPCSALGQRPQFVNHITVAQLRSYVPLQRKLFSAAVRLLKPNGILVYSTCTITIAENEGIVSWALKTFPYLKLKPVEEQFPVDKYGTVGYNITDLTQEQSNAIRRFGPDNNTIGFFIACFVKLPDSNAR